MTQPLPNSDLVGAFQQVLSEAVERLLRGVQDAAKQLETPKTDVTPQTQHVSGEALAAKAEAQGVKAEAAGLGLQATLFEPDLDKVLEPLRTRIKDLASSARQSLEEIGRRAKGAGADLASSVGAGAQTASQAARRAGQSVSDLGTRAADAGRSLGGAVGTRLSGTLDAVRNSATGAAAATGRLASSARQMAVNALQAATNMARTAAAATLTAVRTAVVTAATRAWAVAQRLLNLVMQLNPIGLVIAAVTLLVAAIVIAYQRSTTFRNIVNAAFTAVRNVAVSVFTAIRVIITTVWRGIVAAVRLYVTMVRTVVSAVFTAVRGVVQTVWNGIRAVVTGAVSAVVGTVRRVQQVATIVRDAFNRARSAVADAIGAVVGFVRGLPGRVIGALGGIGRTLYQSGRDLIQGFVNGLRDMAGRIVSAVREFIVDKIPGPIRSALGISSPSRLMAGIGRSIGEGLVAGIDASRDLVEQAMQRLVPTPTATTVRPAVAGLAVGAVAAAVPASGVPRPGLAGAAREPVTVNVYPRAGQSEYEIGRIAARELAWAAKS